MSKRQFIAALLFTALTVGWAVIDFVRYESHESAAPKPPEPTPPPALTGDDGYFPLRVFDQQDDAHAFTARWYSKHLRVMEEPPLYPVAPVRPLCFRFLKTPTDCPSRVARVEADDQGWKVIGKRTAWLSEKEFGLIDRRMPRRLTADEAAHLRHLLDRLTFWSLPTTDDKFGADGTMWVLEGAHDGKYHVVERWCPDPRPFVDFCEYLLTLSGEAPAPDR
jgi:hypothetical protein